MTQSILFVCLGNICRSPSAEGVVRHMARALGQGDDLRLDSAGTANWHAGKPPYGPMQEAAQARGYDLSDLRARRARPEDFHRFDLILAMDAENLENLQAIRPADATARLQLFTDYAPERGADHVPDPYYTRDFDGTLDLIEACAKGLLADL
ncbi:MAG: low molecular weight phosphotyrosine protein phosphatase [Pelagimonas sp.]|jgi:protein-tyrosine phosphatase|nr:low molecular weight phosphotyrosine protein phosphatase [Pelagimonas sp.]